MRNDVYNLMVKNGFTMSKPSPSSRSTDEKGIEYVAQCGLGCDIKRTGRFAIPNDATPEHPSIEAALRHLKWCRNAQKRKAANGAPLNVHLRAARQKAHDKEVVWRCACEVLREHAAASVKEQVAEFKRECGAQGVDGVTANTFKRIKYRIRAAPF